MRVDIRSTGRSVSAIPSLSGAFVHAKIGVLHAESFHRPAFGVLRSCWLRRHYCSRRLKRALSQRSTSTCAPRTFHLDNHVSHKSPRTASGIDASSVRPCNSITASISFGTSVGAKDEVGSRRGQTLSVNELVEAGSDGKGVYRYSNQRQQKLGLRQTAEHLQKVAHTQNREHWQRKLTKRIVACDTVQQLEKIICKHGARLNHIHISAILVRLLHLYNSLRLACLVPGFAAAELLDSGGALSNASSHANNQQFSTSEHHFAARQISDSSCVTGPTFLPTTSSPSLDRPTFSPSARITTQPGSFVPQHCTRESAISAATEAAAATASTGLKCHQHVSDTQPLHNGPTANSSHAADQLSYGITPVTRFPSSAVPFHSPPLHSTSGINIISPEVLKLLSPSPAYYLPLQPVGRATVSTPAVHALYHTHSSSTVPAMSAFASSSSAATTPVPAGALQLQPTGTTAGAPGAVWHPHTARPAADAAPLVAPATAAMIASPSVAAATAAAAAAATAAWHPLAALPAIDAAPLAAAAPAVPGATPLVGAAPSVTAAAITATTAGPISVGHDKTFSIPAAAMVAAGGRLSTVRLHSGAVIAPSSPRLSPPSLSPMLTRTAGALPSMTAATAGGAPSAAAAPIAGSISIFHTETISSTTATAAAGGSVSAAQPHPASVVAPPSPQSSIPSLSPSPVPSPLTELQHNTHHSPHTLLPKPSYPYASAPPSFHAGTLPRFDLPLTLKVNTQMDPYPAVVLANMAASFLQPSPRPASASAPPLSSIDTLNSVHLSLGQRETVNHPQLVGQVCSQSSRGVSQTSAGNDRSTLDGIQMHPKTSPPKLDSIQTHSKSTHPDLDSVQTHPQISRPSPESSHTSIRHSQQVYSQPTSAIGQTIPAASQKAPVHPQIGPPIDGSDIPGQATNPIQGQRASIPPVTGTRYPLAAAICAEVHSVPLKREHISAPSLQPNISCQHFSSSSQSLVSSRQHIHSASQHPVSYCQYINSASQHPVSSHQQFNSASQHPVHSGQIISSAGQQLVFTGQHADFHHPLTVSIADQSPPPFPSCSYPVLHANRRPNPLSLSPSLPSSHSSYLPKTLPPFTAPQHASESTLQPCAVSHSPAPMVLSPPSPSPRSIPQLVSHLHHLTLSQLHIFTPRELTTILYTSAQMNALPPTTTSLAILSHLLNSLSSATVPDLVMTLHAVACARLPLEGQGLERVLLRVSRNWESMQPRHLGCVLYALARMPEVALPVGFVEGLMEAVHMNAGALRPQELSLAFWACGILGLDLPHNASEALLHAAYINMPWFKTQELNNLVYGLARQGLNPGRRWMHRFCLESYYKLPKFAPQELVAVTWSLSVLRHCPDSDWVHALMEGIMEHMDDLPPRQLGVVLHALVKLGCEGVEEYVDVLVEVQLHSSSPWHPQHVAQTLWSLAKLQHPLQETLWCPLYRACHIPFLQPPADPGHLSMIIWAASKCAHPPPLGWTLAAAEWVTGPICNEGAESAAMPQPAEQSATWSAADVPTLLRESPARSAVLHSQLPGQLAPMLDGTAESAALIMPATRPMSSSTADCFAEPPVLSHTDTTTQSGLGASQSVPSAALALSEPLSYSSLHGGVFLPAPTSHYMDSSHSHDSCRPYDSSNPYDSSKPNDSSQPYESSYPHESSLPHSIFLSPKSSQHPDSPLPHLPPPIPDSPNPGPCFLPPLLQCCTAQDLACMLFGLYKLSYSPSPSQLARIYWRLKSLAGALSPRALVMVLRALAGWGARPGGLLCAVLQHRAELLSSSMGSTQHAAVNSSLEVLMGRAVGY